MSSTTPSPSASTGRPESDAQRVAREKAVGQAQRTDARRRRQRAGGRDMLISMAVLVVPILVIVWFFQRTPDRPPVTSVDIASATTHARAAAKFPLLAPVHLPSGWVPVRADWTPSGADLVGRGTMPADTWVVGYQGPDQHYYELDQQAGATPHFVSDFTKDAEPEGTSSVVTGRRWVRYVSGDGTSRYLVLKDATSTSIVGGAVSYDELAAFAGTLSTTGSP